MTLFLARIDQSENRMNWVRAGHDPAILYDPDTDSFSSLNDGNGCRAKIDQKEVFMVAKVKKGDYFEFKVRLTKSGQPFWTMTPEELIRESPVANR